MILIAIAILGGSQCSGADKSKRQIELTVQEPSIAVGRPIRMTLKYKNSGETPWTIADPQESIAVLLQYRQMASTERPYGYSLGKTSNVTVKGPSGQIVSAVVVPNPQPIMIGSEKSREFEIVLERDWTGNLAPGRWIVWIDDQSESLESNRLKLAIQFTPDSVEACLKIAVDKEQLLDKRKWHAEWLQRINPELKLQWPDEKSAEAVQVSREYEVQRQLKKFADFWKANKNSATLRERIAQINTAAGLSAKGD